MIRSIGRTTGAALVACLAFGAGATGQERPHVDPLAMRILKASDTLIQEAGRVHFRARINYDQVLPTGQKLQFGGDLDLAVKRPGKIVATYRGDLDVKKVFCDGKRVTLYDQAANVYGVIEVPPKLDGAVRKMAEEAGFSIPLIDLVCVRPGVERFSNIQSGHYVGVHRVAGVPCHHLAFTGPKVDWQLWIEDSVRFLPRKVVITHKTLPGSPQYVAFIREWDFAPNLPDPLFTFRPPAGAEEIEFLKPGGER